MTPSSYLLAPILLLWIPVKGLLSLEEEPDPSSGTLGRRATRAAGNCLQRTGELICKTTCAGTAATIGFDQFLGKDLGASCTAILPQVSLTMCIGLICEVWGHYLKYLVDGIAPAPEKLPPAPAKLNGCRPLSSLPRRPFH